MRYKFLIVLITVIQISCSNKKQQELPSDIEKETQNRIELGYHLGTVIGIIDKDGTRYYGFGQMSLTDSLKPDRNSIFEIASVTKTFTTALVADLELSGEIEINTSIEQYMPVFKHISAKSKRIITLEDLINHTSGLPRNPNNTTTDDSNRYQDYSVDDLNEYLSNFTIEDSTKNYLYSNLAYLVLENAIESKMGTSYESLMQERILEVLDMSDTHFVVPNEMRDRLVTPFRTGQHVDELDMGEFPASGGLKTTAKDMLRFLAAQLGQYPTTLDKALKLTQVERFTNNEETLGLAWEIMKREESGKTIHYHKGGSNGFVSFAGFNLEDQIGVVVLTNGHRWFSDLGFKILDPTYPLFKAE